MHGLLQTDGIGRAVRPIIVEPILPSNALATRPPLDAANYHVWEKGKLLLLRQKQEKVAD